MKWNDIDLKNKTHGTHKFVCPECSPTRKNKRDLCLSVDIDRGLYNCHHCGAKGSKIEYKPKEIVIVDMPKLNTTDLSEKMFAYFQSRHISTTTIKRNKITEGPRYIPAENKEMNCIWFNYFKNKEHVNTKFRSPKKHFTQVKGASKHFYKIDDVQDTAIICEGEFDALTWEEAGFNYGISVPDGALPLGANYSDTKFEYIDNDIDVLLGVKEIYLSLDNDPVGQHLQSELSRRVGREKCRIINLGQYKDANEVLCTLGKVDGIEYLQTAIINAKPYPIEGAQTVDTFVDEMRNIYHNGFENGIGVGYSELDNHIRWMPRLLYIVTGIPSHGKSTWLDQIIVKLMQNENWKFAVYSPEHEPQMHLHRLLRMLLLRPMTGHDRMTEQEMIDALGWLNERIFYIMPDNEDFGLDNILDISKQLVAQKGVNALVLDPWNTIDHQIPKGMDEGQYTSKALTKLKLFSKRFDCATLLVAHPTKMQKNDNGTYKVPTGYNVSGSAHFYNKADMGITIYRNFDTEIIDVMIWKIKFEGVLGKQGTVQFLHDRTTATYRLLHEPAPHIKTELDKPLNKIARPNEEDFTENIGSDVPF
jgi:twinkle protein